MLGQETAHEPPNRTPAPARDFRLCLVAFPYSATRHTGRGLDRYACELAENLSAGAPNVAVRVVDQGSSSSALDAGKKLLGFARNVFAQPADIHHAVTPVNGAMLVGLRRVPLVVTVHDMIPFNVDSGYDSALKYRFWRQCIRTCVRGSAALIVPHQIIKDELVSRLHADPSRVYVVNHGVDHDLYFPRPELVRPTRKVVYLGEVSRSKGVDLLLRAFAIVNRRLPDTELVIAGKPSKDHELLQELTRTLAVTNITHMGYISEQELPGYYADASVMVFPSRCGFGLSTLEAMACGTPVVALSVLDAPEFIGDAGMLVPPDDERALADSVLRVLTEPELQKKLAEKGIARARQFSWKKMAERSLKVYEDVLRGKTTGSVD